MSAIPRVWLSPNRRALLLGALPIALVFCSALTGAALASGWLKWCLIGTFGLAGYLGALTVYAIFRPRLAYADGHLLVYLRPGSPIRVPIDVVECFFLGQGPTLLANPLRADEDAEEASTIVVRLAEAAEEWKHLEVKPSLGLWCDGYITIRGTWCEPITADLLLRLNSQLVEAHRQVRADNSVTHQEVR